MIVGLLQRTFVAKKIRKSKRRPSWTNRD